MVPGNIESIEKLLVVFNDASSVFVRRHSQDIEYECLLI
jgi:hypothetical protein